MSVFEIICFILGIVGLILFCFAISVMFDNKQKYEFTFKGFIKWALDYLNTKSNNKETKE